MQNKTAKPQNKNKNSEKCLKNMCKCVDKRKLMCYNRLNQRQHGKTARGVLYDFRTVCEISVNGGWCDEC